MLKRLAEAVARLDSLRAVIKETSSVNPDEIDFAYMTNDEIINVAFDYEKLKVMDRDTLDALIFVLAKRLDQYCCAA